jgi:hypothetical protein
MGWSGQTPEEERDEIIEMLRITTLEGAEVKLVAYSNSVHGVTDTPMDLFVLDYGGMLPGADDMVRHQIRNAIKWAEDHPGKLLYLYTDFTRRWYQWEFDENFSGLDNIVYRFAHDHLGDEVEAKIRLWFGLEKIDRKIKGELKVPGRT